MSTIKVNRIENTSTTDGGVSIDVNGHVTIDGQQLPTAGPLSNRNLIINGAMQVAQRGTSHTSQHTINNYGVDRWQVICPNTSAVLVHSHETTGGPEGFNNWLKISPSTADTTISPSDYSSVQQKIEGYNFASAQYGLSDAKEVTVSFKFKTNKAGTYCITHRNNAADRNYIHEFTPVADGNWQTITYTVPGDTTGTWDKTNNIGWRFELFLANGTANQSSTTDTWFGGTYYHSTPNQVNFLDSTSNELGITGVQVELGSKATPFEHELYPQTLAKCQRYYQLMYGNTAGNGHAYAMKAGETTFYLLTGTFATQMRTFATHQILGSVVGTIGGSRHTRTNYGIWWSALVGGYGYVAAPSGSDVPIIGFSAELQKMYKLPILNPDGTEQEIIIRLPHTYIPKHPDNTDYQEYLAWLAEGNEPLPADEPPAAE